MVCKLTSRNNYIRHLHTSKEFVLSTCLLLCFLATGAINISEMIKINHTLQYLNINSNPIGDEGIAAIATTLNNSTISELIMYNCDITVTG